MIMFKIMIMIKIVIMQSMSGNTCVQNLGLLVFQVRILFVTCAAGAEYGP